MESAPSLKASMMKDLVLLQRDGKAFAKLMGISLATIYNEVIGARFYKGPGAKETSARDTEGHGTHIASIVAGRSAKGVSFFGLAPGHARGTDPYASIAM
ncbi:subtilisin-like serine endopeptidase family protein [Cinnamomum micranthum f. kanehirae]|uniref:Subtilisin-like serine endopeptidase family protein n=1 Tax=Cinnamomum micranthum f. kanehirae TaxID=337451 RepID=A0A3S4NE72_9MAGN|nr:subtilisin-like serine endopeptidase family protein [Cinnamomum micranthum f. kanehirae]